jgi:hypothetical protein
MKLFNKPDEMEMSINFLSMRLSWIFENIALVVWLIVDFSKTREISFIPFMIIAVQNMIFFGSKLYMTRKISRTGDEK